MAKRNPYREGHEEAKSSGLHLRPQSPNSVSVMRDGRHHAFISGTGHGFQVYPGGGDMVSTDNISDALAHASTGEPFEDRHRQVSTAEANRRALRGAPPAGGQYTTAQRNQDLADQKSRY